MREEADKLQAILLARQLEHKSVELNMRQKDVASYIGINETYYSLLLSGER
jgi:transcriptional regulator with XRE-family HTH domain